MLISRYKADIDGKTEFEKRRGRRCAIPLTSFGETFWYKQIDRGKGRNKFDIKWHKGVWLGHARDTNEMYLGTAEGVVKSYVCKRLPTDERGNKEMINDM